MAQTLTVISASAAACPRCAASLPANARFCTACGTVSPLALSGPEGDEGREGTGAAPHDAQHGRAQTRRRVPARLKVTDVLALSSVFRLLPVDQRQRLAGLTFRRRYAAGEWASLEGRPGERVFVIASGLAQIWVGAGRGRRVLVHTLTSGDTFGELAGLTGTPQGVSVQALTDLETYVLPDEVLVELAAGFPDFCAALLGSGQVVRVAGLLRRASPFAPLHPQVLSHLAQRLTPLQFQPGQVVFSQGDVGDAFYIVGRGTVAVVIGDNQVASLHGGDCFGEAALLTYVTRTATIRADEATEVLRLDRADFERVVGDHQELREFFIELLRRRNLLAAGVRAEQAPAIPVVDDSSPGLGTSSRDSGWPLNLLAVGLAGLIALLATTPRGGSLLGPAAGAALAMAPLVAVRYFRATGFAASTTRAGLTVQVLAGFAAALILEWPMRVAAALGQAPLGGLVLGVAATGVLAEIAVVADKHRQHGLEMDGLAAGTAIGMGYGLASALVRWTLGLAAGSAPLTLVGWFELLAAPALFALTGAVLGASVWEVHDRGRPRLLLWAQMKVAALLLLARSPAVLELPRVLDLVTLSAAVVGAFLVARVRFERARRAQAAALVTLSLTGVLSTASGVAVQVVCRGCEAVARSGELYCSHCGQSLSEDD